MIKIICFFTTLMIISSNALCAKFENIVNFGKCGVGDKAGNVTYMLCAGDTNQINVALGCNKSYFTTMFRISSEKHDKYEVEVKYNFDEKNYYTEIWHWSAESSALTKNEDSHWRVLEGIMNESKLDVEIWGNMYSTGFTGGKEAATEYGRRCNALLNRDS